MTSPSRGGAPETPDTDSKKQVSDYERYVNTAALLACQRPIGDLVNSHELFFQVMHQVMELWMKVMDHELEVVIGHLQRRELRPAISRLRRVREIERLLTDQMAIMETLAPADYHPIRRTLGRGSGQESPGFHAILGRAPEVWDAYAPILQERNVSLLDLHKDPPAHEDLFALTQALMDVDSGFQRFREAHFHVVKRVIGADVRSLKGIPAQMLEHTSKQPLFPGLWEAINEFTRVDWPGY